MIKTSSFLGPCIHLSFIEIFINTYQITTECMRIVWQLLAILSFPYRWIMIAFCFAWNFELASKFNFILLQWSSMYWDTFIGRYNLGIRCYRDWLQLQWIHRFFISCFCSFVEIFDGFVVKLLCRSQFNRWFFYFDWLANYWFRKGKRIFWWWILKSMFHVAWLSFNINTTLTAILATVEFVFTGWAIHFAITSECYSNACTVTAFEFIG